MRYGETTSASEVAISDKGVIDLLGRVMFIYLRYRTFESYTENSVSRTGDEKNGHQSGLKSRRQSGHFCTVTTILN